MQCLTIDKIVATAPEVGAILEAARRDTGNKDLAFIFYKARLARLVGRGAHAAELETPEAYETTIKTLCEALDY